tara:strand:+ start:240 stop:641 length:402 start_codon:yes stop_codon:yes gene_type:complete
MRKILLIVFILFNLSSRASKPTINDVYNECIKQGVLAPYIVTAQAVLEASWTLDSHNARVNKNLFGLTKPDGTGYFKFNTWQESVIGYRDMIQYKLHRGEGYYKFLNRIGYASDPKYEYKVRWIVKRLLNKEL